MRMIILALVLVALVADGLQAGAGRPQITFRIHLQRVEASGSDSQILPIALTQPDQVINVGRYAELSENQVQSIVPTPDGGMMVLFTGTGAKILETVTSSNQGLILVVLLNGRVVYAPLIDMPLRSGRMLIPGPLDPVEVAALQQLIKKRDKKG